MVPAMLNNSIQSSQYDIATTVT